ncbi:transposase [Nonomuraea sp. NPDC049784]|uniref:RNA-guided endonuclease InsQ/TnpB family protein n=1 Tax=Nonomuraea sp. NPDC049784 TaxID=3154361 RepID=UPI0033E4AC12
MLTGRRYRVEFAPEQAVYAEQVGGICRSVWNTALQQRRAYRQRGAFIGYAEQCKQLADAKQDFGWLADAPSHCLQQTLKDLDQACRTHGAFKVRWRSHRRWSPSFRFPDAKQIVVERLSRKWGRVKLPKLGWVRFRWSRPLAAGPVPPCGLQRPDRRDAHQPVRHRRPGESIDQEHDGQHEGHY